METLLERLLPPLVDGLQNTPVPDFLVAGGLFLIIISIIGHYNKQELIRSRIKWARICGFFFIFLGIFLHVGILNFPSCTYTQVSGWEYTLLFIVQKLTKTSEPVIFTGGGILIIIISIIGVFGGLEITSSRQKAGLFFGFFVLLPLGIFLYVEPTTSLSNFVLTETVNVPFSGGKSGVKTCQSYKGSVTITVSGTALTSKNDVVDAFYLFSSSPHKHLTEFTLWINGKPVDALIHSVSKKIRYRDNHVYTFAINIPKGTLTFGVGDGLSVNKEGNFTITVSQGTS